MADQFRGTETAMMMMMMMWFSCLDLFCETMGVVVLDCELPWRISLHVRASYVVAYCIVLH